MNESPEKLTFSVMLATRNRRDELQRTLTKLSGLDPKPHEVLICADGCTDDTVAMVRREFPSFSLLENISSQGSVASRDRMLRAATGEIMVSLDDDSYPIDADFLSRLERVLQLHPEAAVITFAELRGPDSILSGPTEDLQRGHYVAAYPNCATAMRRILYGRVGTFPKFFRHMYEEPDYALQCYGRGFGVWFEPSLKVRHHLTVTRRESIPRHHLNARNELWSVLLRCPWPWLPLVAAYRVVRQFIYAGSQGFAWVYREPRWWMMAAREFFTVWAHRSPVSWRSYAGWLRLSRQPISERDDLQRAFGSQAENASAAPAKIPRAQTES